MTMGTYSRLRALLATGPAKLRIIACGLLAILAAACGSSVPRASTAIPASPAATITPAAGRLPLACHAQATNARPRDHTTVGIRIRTVARANVTATESVPAGQHAAGRASAKGKRTLWFRVGDATPGAQIVIEVHISRHGRKGACQASFRPRSVPVPAAALAQPTASPSPSPSPAQAAPPPPPTAASCYPLSNAGTCYEPGEFCRESDHGVSGVAGDGKKIICQYNNGWRWEPA
jgi:hypothetical protein